MLGVFDHIGIVVRDIEKAIAFYSEVLGWKMPTEGVYSNILHMNMSGEKMKYAMLSSGDTYIELIEPEEGTWSKYLVDKGEGAICEICVLVEDVQEAISILETKGITPMDWSNKPLSKKFMIAPSGSKCFYLPKEKTNGTLIEILQRPE